VALESSSCGTPVIASAVGGLTTLVQPGVNGLLLEDRSPVAWADAVEEVIVADQEGFFALRAVELAQQYSWSSAASSLVALIEQRRNSELVAC
jgi:D-inositol-3-phosphate glycosyltransferase